MDLPRLSQDGAATAAPTPLWFPALHTPLVHKLSGQCSTGVGDLATGREFTHRRSATGRAFDAGIGQQIPISTNLFDYPKVATLVVATIVIVLLVDRLSAAIRRRLAY